jgi:lysophospholipase L1-like esterase
MYNSWLLVKQAYLYASIEDVLEAEADGTFGNRKYAVIGGGAVMHKIDGLWVGNIGVYGSSAALPATTYLGVGCSARVGTASTGYVTYYVDGSTVRLWVSAEHIYTVKDSLEDAGNLFVVSEQVAPDVIADTYIGTSGEQVSDIQFYVSKPIPVTPGDLLMLSVTNSSSFVVPIPISFWTTSMTWVSTPIFTEVTRTYGQLVVPAGAAYARINVVGNMQEACFLGIVKSNPEVCRGVPTKLVALGDSITAGIADVHDSVDLWWKLAGRQAGFTNFVTLAVEGSRMSSIIANQLPNIPADADVIQIMTGIPDYVFQEWPLGTINDTSVTQSFYGGLRYVAEYVIERYPLARLIFCTPIKWSYGLTANAKGNRQEDYAEAVRLVASEYCLQLVDFYDGAGVNWTTQRNAEMYLDASLLHPNKLGNMLMANKYVPILKDKTGIATRVEAKPIGHRRTVRHALGLRNIFVPEEQVAPNIIENTFIGLSGEQVSSTAFVVSKAYPVTPGQLLSIAAGLTNIDVPVSFWTSEMVWISTPVVSVIAGRTYGLIQVPATAAFMRLNYATGTAKVVQCYVVPQDLDLYNTRGYTRKLIAIGDSITAGELHTDATNIWWKIAAENAGYATTNEGRDGASFAWLNLSSVTYRVWNRDYANDADIMLVMAGINDWTQNFALGNPTDPPATFETSFYGSLKFAADCFSQYYPLTKHIWCSPIKCLSGLTPNASGATLADYAEAIIYVAKEYGFTAIDLYNDFYDFSAYPYNVLALTYDLIHPNVVGHRLLANHIQPYLEAGGALGIPYTLGHPPASAGAVSSVFGRTGAVTATSGDYNTSQVTENTNLYYTDARVLAAVLTGLSTASSTDVVATDSVLAAIGKLQAQCDLAARTDTTNTFTAQQTVSVTANNALLLNVTVNNAFTQAISAYNTALPTGGQFCFEFGTAGSTNNMGHFGFLNVGGAGSNTNAITFGLYGANQLLTINAAGLATFSGRVSAAGGIGYNTGSGGTVTQGTSKSTGVTLNKLCGTITMNGAALAANTSVAFTLTNSTIANTDMVLVQHNSAGTLGSYDFCVNPGSGSALITVRNNSSSSRSEAIVLRFFVLKAVVA